MQVVVSLISWSIIDMFGCVPAVEGFAVAVGSVGIVVVAISHTE